MYQFSVSALTRKVVVLVPFLAGVGCGPSQPKTVPVSGTVLQGGVPVEGASVTLTRGAGGLTGGEMSIGKTDAAGHFELVTHFGPQTSAPGAVPGEYEVVISKHVPPPGTTQAQYDAMVATANKIGETGAQVPKDKQPPQLVEKFPERFSVHGKSQLKATIPETGPAELSFPLD